MEKCPRLKVDTVLCDFEKAEHEAIQQHFPEADIRGCLFHWKQAVRRRLMKLPDYPSDPVLKEELETLFGLAFVPVGDVVDSWEYLKTNLSPSTVAAAATFLQYFESTWIRSAVYPVKMWNMHQTVIDDGPRTNNHSEGNNNALSRFIGCSNPSGGLLADALSKFNEQAELHIEHCLTGSVSGAKKRKKYRDNDERIKKAIGNYGTVGTSLYCRSLSRLV